MSGVRARFVERFAHPRLALATLAGIATGIVGIVLWLAGPDALATPGFRIAVLGYVVALFGVTGYVSIGVFERRERRLE